MEREDFVEYVDDRLRMGDRRNTVRGHHAFCPARAGAQCDCYVENEDCNCWASTFPEMGTVNFGCPHHWTEESGRDVQVLDNALVESEMLNKQRTEISKRN